MPSRRPSRGKSKSLSINKQGFFDNVKKGENAVKKLYSKGYRYRESIFKTDNQEKQKEFKNKIKKYQSMGYDVSVVTAPGINVFGKPTPTESLLYIKK